jgi:hypothetical protein
VRLLVYILFFTGFTVHAQYNLVPNPSFEELKPTKPSRTFNHFSEPFHVLIDPWYIATRATADYYNSDKSVVYLTVPVKTARRGSGRIGLVMASGRAQYPYTEYLQVKLGEPLKKDSLYCVAFHFALDKRCRFYAQSVDLCLSNEALTRNDSKTIRAKAQLQCTDSIKNKTTKGWQECSATYRATGGEQYLTLGQFDDLPPKPRALEGPIPGQMADFSMYAYYYFDDVSVVPLNNKGECTTESIARAAGPQNHFLFLVDVSASMIKAGYLDATKKTLHDFIAHLDKNDLVSIIAFDAHTHTLLRAQKVSDSTKVLQAIDRLAAGTTTNIEKAIERAYAAMDSTAASGANNRVVLISDARFDLSSDGRHNIQTHYSEKGVYFSMIQFGSAENKKMRKLIERLNGMYTQARIQDPGTALDAQVVRPVKKYDYTLPRGGLGWEPITK